MFVTKLNIFLSLISFITLYRTTLTVKIYPLVSDLNPLLEMQNYHFKDLEKNINRRTKVLGFLEQEIARFETQHKRAIENSKNLSTFNPITTFTTMNRIFDFSFIQGVAKNKSGIKTNKSLKYPTKDDLARFIDMIALLQDVYQLNATLLADGLLVSTQGASSKIYTERFSPMSASDCGLIALGLNRLLEKHFNELDNRHRDVLTKQVISWLLEALRLNDAASLSLDYSYKVQILWILSKRFDKLEDHTNYLKWTKELIALAPQYANPELDKKIYEHQLQQNKAERTKKSKLLQRAKKEILVIKPAKEIEYCLKGFRRRAYRKLCRGEIDIAPEVKSRLKCWYFGGLHPFTKLAPFKVEQLYYRPTVYLFYDVITDNEINNFKSEAFPNLKPVTAVNGPRPVTSMVYLISKGANVGLNTSRAVNQRIADISGLPYHPTDVRAVNSYGVGGFYVGHVDGLRVRDTNGTFDKIDMNFEKSNKTREEIIEYYRKIRLTTSVIVYLSDVELGGATVFPVLGLYVPPVKGAALLWNNLLPWGDLDYATCHSSCPVLRGSKWVYNSFIRNRNHELVRPCTEKFTSRIIKDIPPPVPRTRTTYRT